MSTKSQRIAQICFLVPDYDEGIDYFVNSLGFTKTQDTDLGGGRRWVTVQPPGSTGTVLALQVPSKEEQRAALGNQAGGRVWLFLYTDDFWRDYNEMKQKGVEFMEEPRTESYGIVAVFRDKWGNKWDFMQPASAE